MLDYRELGIQPNILVKLTERGSSLIDYIRIKEQKLYKRKLTIFEDHLLYLKFDYELVINVKEAVKIKNYFLKNIK